jgi:MFS transporter, ACS family, glucarate transporter
MAFLMYMERGAIGAAAPIILREFHISKITLGWSISAFNWSYALFQVPGGWLADRLGPRIVLSAAMLWWATFTAATGLSFDAVSLGFTRFLFGIGEAGAFPAGSRALVRWLPIRRRAFGQGFQHAGSRLGAALAPILVVLLISIWGWRSIFFLFGIAGTLWAVWWYLYYRNSPSGHRGVNTQELALLEQDSAAALPRPVVTGVPWSRILRSLDLWILSVCYFCYGWVLWLYLAWFPTYLREARHFSEFKSGLASIPLLAATAANVAGGLLSDRLVSYWNNLRRGRIAVSCTGFALAGLALLPGVFAASPALALLYFSLALAGLELTVAVSWAICIDIGGACSGSVSSVMNTWGNLGGALAAVMVGYLATGLGWTAPFALASVLCILSAILISFTDPRRTVHY